MQHTTKTIRAALAGAVVMFTFGLTAARAEKGRCSEPYHLGGTWAVVLPTTDPDGTPDRVELTSLQIPLDPFGRTAAMRLEFLNVGRYFGLLTQLLDVTISGSVGHAVMTGPNTARFTCYFYAVSKTDPKEIRAIGTNCAELKFVAPGRVEARDTVSIYLTNSGVKLVAPLMPGGISWPYGDADADHDLLPDAGAVPFVQATVEGVGKRVPLLP